jgi:UDP-GlcNAc:undecaprenyl-phosphate GlcNAc-1-phosphate transferase
MTALAFALLFPLAVSWLLTRALIRWAPRLGLIDHPDPRKVHHAPTPRGGGLAIFTALTLTLFLVPLFSSGPVPLQDRLLLGSGIVALGLIDDLRPLPWWPRLAVQAGVALLALLPDVSALGPGGLALALFWVVGLTNAFNMLDNMDGLSAGVAWLTAGFFALAYLCAGVRDPRTFLPFLAFLGAVGGFLWFNFPLRARPAPIFMGDAGSTFLGFFLGLAGVDAVLRPGTPSWGILLPVCLCAVPCYDLGTVVLIRLRQGRSPFHPDKQHLSHRLVARGLSPPAAVRLIYGLGMASGTAGLLLYAVGSWTGAVLTAGQLALWWACLAVLEWLLPRRH